MKKEGRITIVSKNIWRGTKSLWKKYHFIVPKEIWVKEAKYLWGIVANRSPLVNPMDVTKYNLWLDENKKEIEYKKLKYQPLISVLVPVYNVKGKYLRECIESVLRQRYENYELCLVDDASTDEETLAILKEYEDNKKVKTKHRKTNGHISKATNDFIQEFERNPTPEELLEVITTKYKKDIKDKNDLLDLKVSYVDESSNDDDEPSNYGDMAAYNRASASYNDYEQTETDDFNKRMVTSMLAKLSPRKQQIIKMRFGMYEESKGLRREYEREEIAEKLGLTSERV